MPDIIVLDVMLPDCDGFTLARQLRAAHGQLPVLFLTARDGVDDRIAGLTAGGDDYVTKPFSLEELVLRRRAILRRTQPTRNGHAGVDAGGTMVTYADLELDDEAHEVRRAGALVALSPTEFNLLRYQFVADASHELRTPLTSIRGFAELYRRGGARTPADVELLTGRIEAEATRMGVLVDDLLLLARLDQQRALDITDVDLLVLAADAVHDARARDPDRPVTLTPGNDSVHVLGDEHKLRQVVTNLVTNALIHTPAGTAVALTVRQHVPSQRDEPPVAQAGTQKLGYAPVGVLEVRDEGPGIPPGQASHVFDRFHSFDPGRSHNRGGSGLGLAITAAILEAHNGRIELHTASPHGTTFRALLPLTDLPR